MTVTQTRSLLPLLEPTRALDDGSAATYAEWFAVLADPTRVRLLHAVSTAPAGSIKVGDLATPLGISQSTCSHHVRKLADVGFVAVDKVGTASIVSVNPACCTGLPHAADVVMGTLADRAVLPRGPAGRRVHPPDDRRRPAPRARHLRRGRRHPQRHVRDRGAVGTQARREVAARAPLGRRARRHGRGVGRGRSRQSTASATRASAETSVYVTETARGRGVGKALLHRQVTEADRNGLWTLQTAVFPENRASIALHHSAGYRTLAVRPRIAQLDGVWRDTVLLERRRRETD